MNVFLDTSALFKLYHNEIGTEELDKFLAEHDIEQFYISALAPVEFYSAVTKKVRTKEITTEQAEELLEIFEKDLNNYSIVSLENTLLVQAKNLISQYAVAGLRTLDAIQLASMLAVQKFVDVVKTSDTRLAEIAKVEGFELD